MPAWGETDFLLTQALALYEQDHCSRDHYLPETTDMNNAGWYIADDSTVCWACAALDEYHAEHKKAEPQPGQLLAVRRRRPEEA